MSKHNPLVCWLQECNRDSLPLVGGKNASLGELINAGVRVPPGFAITTHSFDQFFHDSGLDNHVHAQLKSLDATDSVATDAASASIRSHIEEAPISIELEDVIAEYYRQLSVHCNVPAVPVAVRSSATAEDLPDASFAGQQDTYLWIRGIDDVLHHVRRCFSSLFTARAIAYRARMGYDHGEVALSVGIQKMANSRAAGVMFTLNPANGDRSSIVINANFGFGESVVSGEVTPDEFLVSKVSLELMKRVIAKKEVYYAVDRETHSCRRYELPPERQEVQTLPDEDVIELARMGKLIEQHYGKPMDIEWAVDGNMADGSNILILQARPETVWSSKQTATQSVAAKSAMDHILASLMSGKKVSTT
jgi:pyruvate, water dikinase